MCADSSRGLKLVEEFVIPKCQAKAFLVKKGQILRVTAHEGKQVVDMRFINADNQKEQHCSWWSAHLNSLEGTGGSKRIKNVYSKPPYERVMLTVIDDKVGDHFFDGSCSPMVVQRNGEFGSDAGITCEQLMTMVLEPYGISLAQVDDSSTFNVWMPIRFEEDEKGTFVFCRPSCEKGDYIEFRAEMNILVATTSCPQTNIINDWDPKGIQYQIFE